MGTPQRTAAELFAARDRSAPARGEAKLTCNELPAQGMTTTYAHGAVITDSAASGTAIACGRKTALGVIAMDRSKTEDLPTLAELAHARGMKVGLVSSVSIDHATPACFYAHGPTRGDYYGIAVQMAESDFDFFAGGGPKGNLPSRRRGGEDVLAIARRNGFTIARTRKEFEELAPGAGKVMAFDAYLDENAALPYELDRPAQSVSLAEYTRKAIELLDGPQGFFLMVEGGKIDWACHANDAAAAIADTLAFDEAVAAGLEFYQTHPEETLLVVTGDHECGGMTIGFAGTRYSTFFEKIAHQKMSHLAFNAQLAELKAAKASFADAMGLARKTFGLALPGTGGMPGMVLTDLEVEELREAYARSLGGQEERADDRTYLLYGGYEPFTVKLTHTLNHKAGIGWTTYSHTGVPVPTSAVGVGSERFNGYYDNTDIFAGIVAAAALESRPVATK
jgi:alkaline phosphatase